MNFETCFIEKYPKDLKRYLGLEFEFISKHGSEYLAKKIVKANLGHLVEIKGDGSIQQENQYPFTHEVTVLVLEKEYQLIIPKILKILRDGGKVNESCGLHIHIDMRSRKQNLQLIYNNLFCAQPILYAMNPVSRQNRFAKKQQFKKIELVKRWRRNFGINICSLETKNTIEVRIHSGTLHTESVLNWIEILLAIVRYDKLILARIKQSNIFCKKLNINNMLHYINDKIKIYNSQLRKIYNV